MLTRVLVLGAALGGASAGPGKAFTVEALCKDATKKDLESGTLVHEHLKEIEKECKNDVECESSKVVRIGAAKQNVTDFYIHHCRWHLRKAKPDLDALHKAVDDFEDEHKKEIQSEFHDQIHKAMKGDASFVIRFLCQDEISQKVEDDDGLVHEHLNEISKKCKGKKRCSAAAVVGLIAAKEDLAADFTEKCVAGILEAKKPPTALKEIHTKADAYSDSKKKQIRKALHDGIHKAMRAAGISAKFETFSEPVLGSRVMVPGQILAAGLLASVSLVGGLVFMRRRRGRAQQGAVLVAEDDVEQLKEAFSEE